ncbi:MAG: DDE-type integrase/transposase/recombinase [Limnochordia bacterium]|jgi:putative transposase
MDDKTRTELALFRFSLIAPLVSGTLQGSAKEYIEEACAKRYDVPGLGQREFSPATLKHWLSTYRRYGLEGLKKQPRSDRGHFRRLTAEAQQLIKETLKASPKRSAVAVYQDVLAANLTNPPSLSTVQRFIKQTKDALVEPEIERRRFECRFANDCWQSDVCIGPYLLLDGKKKKTYLVAILDDASRLIVHSEFFFEESYLTLEATLRRAFLKRGIPKKLFVDNAKIYHTVQLRLICARLGISLSFCRPYSPASKGKIERYFRTFRGQCLDSLDVTSVSSLDELNRLNTAYFEGMYNQRPHSSLEGDSPIERFLRDQDQLRFATEVQLEHIFLHEVKRSVTKDATISLNRVIFEVPQIYCGRQVTVLYRPKDLSHAYLQSDSQLIPIEPVRTIDNAQIPRKQNIDYTRFYEGGS